MIIELYFARNEQAIKETDIEYGKLCVSVRNNILSNEEDSEECEHIEGRLSIPTLKMMK